MDLSQIFSYLTTAFYEMVVVCVYIRKIITLS